MKEPLNQPNVNSSESIPMHKDLQQIVNISVDINRAVWAGNLMKTNPIGSCTSEANRDAYVEACLRSAFTTLKQILPNYQLDLDLKL